jgi:pilus assembly protein Flp/PilA
MRNYLTRFAKDRSGATAVEYALMVSLLAIAMIGALTGVGQALVAKFGEIGSAAGN